MWGTIARMQVRPEVPEAYLLAQLNAFNQDRLMGMESLAFYRSAVDSREVWMIAIFDNEEAYRKNAASRSQHAVYQTLHACLERDPEWNDVSDLVSYSGSGLA